MDPKAIWEYRELLCFLVWRDLFSPCCPEGEAFSYVGLDWHELVEVDPKYYRPAEVDLLIGDASKAKRKLGWEARTRFKELVRLMVDADMEPAEKEARSKLR